MNSKKKSNYDKVVRQRLPKLAMLQSGSVDDKLLLDSKAVDIRLKDRLLGAVTLQERSIPSSTGNDPILQVVYVGVRTRFQQAKIGRLLLNKVISAELHSSEILFTFASVDSVRFFRNCGFSDDPMLCGRYQQLDENWTDAVPMVF